MSDSTELRCWPSCVHAIDWSHDGIIALASDNQVELLFPNTESSDTDRSATVPQWAHFALQVPWFTKAELPTRDPAPVQIFSIGEEISTSFPIKISWSPPGIAKHRRCALAALTSNLVLSIWSSEGKVNEPTSWDRRLIINDALGEHFDQTSKQSSGVTGLSKDPRRIRCRIRAFAWAPPTLSDSNAFVGTQLDWGTHLVAVSNDENQVVLLSVNSPTSTLGEDDFWSSKVHGIFNIESTADGTGSDSVTFDEIMNLQRHVTNLAWSPWIATHQGLVSILAYATNDDVRARTIKLSHGTISINPEKVFASKVELRFAGPMSWAPKIYDNDTLKLAIFSISEVLCLHISPLHTSILGSTSQRIDNQCDPVSGLAWDTQSDASTRLHVSSLTGSTRHTTVALELTPSGPKDIVLPDWPYWREQIRGAQGHFSAHHDLKGNANAKTWGLAVSPLGDYIAACHTVHPTDMIEYGTPRDRSATVAISRIWKTGDELRFPKMAVNAEALFSTARKWLDNNVESAEHLPRAKEETWEKLCQVYGQLDNSPRATVQWYDKTKLEMLIERFKQDTLLNPSSMKDRFQILAQRICMPADTAELPRTLIAFRLAKAIQHMPPLLSATHHFSRVIVDSCRKALQFIQDLISEAPTQQAPEPTAPRGASQPTFANESCTFCNAQVPFTDLSSAMCPNGHEFMRCGLSFLAIQAPGRTKYCGICNTRFLSDEYILSEHFTENDTTFAQDENVMEADDGAEARDLQAEGADIDERRQEDSEIAITEERVAEDPQSSEVLKGGSYRRNELPVTLARVLFLACDVCIYCGGKFVG